MSADIFLQNFNMHTNYLRRFAMRLTRDKSTADDLFQETALNAFRNKNKFQHNTNMKSWLGTIMKNIFINLYRKNKRKKVVQDTSDELYMLNSAQILIKNEGEMNVRMNEIISLIEQLDKSYKIPFMMAYQGYKYDEIQEILGNLPLGTIKSRIHLARKILKKQIDKMYDNASLKN